ncbi:hypothetical protein GR927_28245 [Mycolicibacterium sp. 3033]|nr:hypothetical protein [Mycolicibacterium aurantiacum]
MNHPTPAIFVAVMIAVTSCTPTDHTDPTTVRDREAVLESLRQIDPCTLYNGGDSSLTVDGPTAPESCSARNDNASGTAEVRLSVAVGSPASPPQPDWIEHRALDGVAVEVASFWDSPQAPPANERGSVVSAGCSYTARYPDEALIMVSVSAPPQIDGCAVAETVTRTAISNFDQRPGSNPAAQQRPALAGDDPCAPLTLLDIEHDIVIDVAALTLSSCTFTMDTGASTELSLDYLDADIAAAATPRHEQRGLPVLGGDGLTRVLVGEPFDVAGQALFPAVTLTQTVPDPAAADNIVDAVITHYY